MRRRPRAVTRGVTKECLTSKFTSAEAIAGHYDQGRVLGEGAFGSARLVRDQSHGQERVCKTVSIADLRPDVYEMMKKEVAILSHLDHPSVVRLYEWAEDTRARVIVMILEYIPGGNCDDLLQESGTLSEPLVARLTHQLVIALNYCHSRSVVHRDVKPENMVLTRKSSNNPHCKLIDFGLATVASNLMRERVGTPEYQAPEVMANRPYSKSTDIWSTGITAFELLTGRTPFEEPDQGRGSEDAIAALRSRLSAYRSFGSISSLLECSDHAIVFLGECLRVDANQRLSAASAMRHTWFDNCNLKAGGLTKAMARSLALYTSAPEVVRCCLLSIAARRGPDDLEALGAAFLAADTDGDGQISAADLEEALGQISTWWFDNAVDVDVHELMEAADLSHTGGLGFTEFVAAAMYSQHPSLDDLVVDAFHALDDDRDGYIRVQDIRGFFREGDSAFLQTLPQDRPFELETWCSKFWEYNKGEDTPSDHGSRTPRPAQVGFLDYFFACHQRVASGDSELEIFR